MSGYSATHIAMSCCNETIHETYLHFIIILIFNVINSNDYLCNVYARTSYTVSVAGWWEKIINFNPTSGYEVGIYNK